MIWEQGWRVRVVDDLMMDGKRLNLWLPRGDVVAQLIGFDEHGYGIMRDHDPMTVPEFPGFVFPNDALEAVGRVLRPGPSEAQLDEVRAALLVEQGRVDRVLDGLMP